MTDLSLCEFWLHITSYRCRQFSPAGMFIFSGGSFYQQTGFTPPCRLPAATGKTEERNMSLLGDNLEGNPALLR